MNFPAQIGLGAGYWLGKRCFIRTADIDKDGRLARITVANNRYQLIGTAGVRVQGNGCTGYRCNWGDIGGRGCSMILIP